MTNEDIIKGLTLMRKNFDPNSVYGSYCIDCLDAAIEALKEQPEHNQNTSSKQPDLETFGIKTEETCEDVISRRAAFDAKQEFRNPNVVRNTEARTAYDRTYANGWNDCNLAWINAIKALPSVQPEIIHCKDCKHIQKWRSEESAKKFGQIYECARNVFDCPKPEDFCSHAERRTDG